MAHRFQLSSHRQAYKISNRYKFWGRICLKTEHAGRVLAEYHQRACAREGNTRCLLLPRVVGGIFFQNYPGGIGLTSGAVFGLNRGIEALRGVSAKTQNE
jgi:hypothetical protein